MNKKPRGRKVLAAVCLLAVSVGLIWLGLRLSKDIPVTRIIPRFSEETVFTLYFYDQTEATVSAEEAEKLWSGLEGCRLEFCGLADLRAQMPVSIRGGGKYAEIADGVVTDGLFEYVLTKDGEPYQDPVYRELYEWLKQKGVIDR